MVKLVGLCIDKELHERSKDYCKKTGRSFSGFVSFLLNKYMKDNSEIDN